jgi:uncharacterized membrane protein
MNNSNEKIILKVRNNFCNVETGNTNVERNKNSNLKQNNYCLKLFIAELMGNIIAFCSCLNKKNLSVKQETLIRIITIVIIMSRKISFRKTEKVNLKLI